MKYQVLFVGRLMLASALLVVLGSIAPSVDAKVDSEFDVSWKVLQTYGHALAWRVFDPAARRPDFWLAGENLEFLARLTPAERQRWRPQALRRTPGGVSLEPAGDALMTALFDLCSGAARDSGEALGVEQVGSLEEHLFRWTRTGIRNFFDPMMRWMGRGGIAEHPGTTGDMICRMVLKRHIRLRWPEPINNDEFGPSMSPHKLLLALGHDDASTRAAALAEIAERGGIGASVALFIGLQDGEPEVRYGAALVLEQLAERRWGAAGSRQ